jgi:hypothetical protein
MILRETKGRDFGNLGGRTSIRKFLKVADSAAGDRVEAELRFELGYSERSMKYS